MKKFEHVLNPPVTTLLDYELETVCKIRRSKHYREFEKLTDGQVVILWRAFSEELFCAGFMICNDDYQRVL